MASVHSSLIRRPHVPEEWDSLGKIEEGLKDAKMNRSYSRWTIMTKGNDEVPFHDLVKHIM